MNSSTGGRSAVPTLRISHDARFVVVNGRRTELSPAEAALLSCLVAHAGEPVSRARLHFALRSGSKGRSIPGRAVDFAMRRLRLKLEPDPTTPRMLFTVRGRGYRFVPPPESEARARTRSANPDVASSLAHGVRRRGGLIQILGGSAPARSGLVRAVIDAMGGPPIGGVLWVTGRFHDPDDLGLAIATALGPGIPLDSSVAELLAGRAQSILVIDAIASANAELLTQIRTWRAAAPKLAWVVMSAREVPLDRDAVHDLGASADPGTVAEFVQQCSPKSRQVLAQLLATPGAVDIDLLMSSEETAVLEEVDGTGLVRISGRGTSRRATLITGATATMAASLPTHDQHQGQTLARQLVSTLVPEFRPSSPWDLLFPPAETVRRAVRHHPLLMASIDDATRNPRSRELEVAVSALAVMCGGLPRTLLGDWLRTRGRRMSSPATSRPRLQAMVHLALAWLEVPITHLSLLADPYTTGGTRTTGPGAPRLEDARRHLATATRLAEFHGFDQLAAAAQVVRARSLAAEGAVGEALQEAHTARLLHQLEGEPIGMAAAALTIAQLHAASEHPDLCAHWLGEAVPLLETGNRPNRAAQARVVLGRLALSRGNDFLARLHIDTALVHARGADDLQLIASAAQTLAEVEQRAGHEGEATLRQREARRAEQRLGAPRVSTSPSRRSTSQVG